MIDKNIIALINPYRKILFRYIPSGLILILVLITCYWSAMVSKFGNKCSPTDASWILSAETKKFTLGLGSQLLEWIEKRDYNKVIAITDESVRQSQSTQLKKGLDQIRDLLPNEPVTGITIVGAKFETSITDKKIDKITSFIKYDYVSRSVVAELTYFKSGDQFRVFALNVYPLEQVLASSQATFANLTAQGFLVVLAMFGILCTIVTALIICINTDIEKYKWLWIIFVISGLFGIDFNWTSQTFSFAPIALRFFGIGYFKSSCYSPLELYMSIPVGAICFIVAKYGFKKFSKK